MPGVGASMSGPAAGFASADGAELQLITFDVGGDLFALDIMGIRQILKYEGSTDVPKAPDFIEGIIVLRDEVIPIVDLRKRLFRDADGELAEKRVLVVSTSGLVIGLKVDRVRKIVPVRASSVLPAPALVQGSDARFFLGVVKIEGSVVLLLDLARVLSTEERAVLGGGALA